MAPDGFTCNITIKTMAKPTEHESTDGGTPNTIITVKICNGKRFFNAPPFPSINSIARARANAFSKWEK
jgi:hypothetical protein